MVSLDSETRRALTDTWRGIRGLVHKWWLEFRKIKLETWKIYDENRKQQEYSPL